MYTDKSPLQIQIRTFGQTLEKSPGHSSWLSFSVDMFLGHSQMMPSTTNLGVEG